MTTQTFHALFQLDDSATLSKRPRDKMNALLDNPDTTAAVQALSPVEFYDLYHEVGPGDAMALLEYASAEQVQTCLDLDIWRGDEISDEALTPWIEPLLALPVEKFAELFDHIDPEIIALYLHRNVHLYVAEDKNDEVEIPETESQNIAQTPDFLYWVAYPEDDDKAEILRQLVDKLYAAFGVKKAWSILEGMHWEMETDLQEQAYHFRTERIRELGFMPRNEAAAIFATLPVAKLIDEIKNAADKECIVRTGCISDKLTMALAAVDDSPAADTYFAKILSQLPNRLPIRNQLVAIAQQIATFDGYQPHETDGFDNAMILGIAYINLGLEYASEHNDALAAKILRSVPLRRLVTLGWNITLELRRKAKILTSRGHLSIIDDQKLSLVPLDIRDKIDGMLCDRPRPRHTSLTPFIRATDIQSAAAAIADVATRELFFGEALHKTRDDISLLAYSHDLVMGVENVTFDNVAITFLTCRALNRPQPWCVLKSSELPERSVVLNAVSFDNIKTLFRSNLPDSTLRALSLFASQLKNCVESQWPENVRIPDPTLMQALLLEDEDI